LGYARSSLDMAYIFPVYLLNKIIHAGEFEQTIAPDIYFGVAVFPTGSLLYFHSVFTNFCIPINLHYDYVLFRKKEYNSLEMVV